MSGRTLFAQIWRPMLAVIPLTFAINAFLVTGALDLGSEAQTARRLARIGDHWQHRLPAGAPLELDPVTRVYPGHALLPDAVRSLLGPDQRGLFELGESDDEYFVLARSAPGGQPYYVVEHHSEVKPSDRTEWRLFLWYAGGTLPCALLVLWAYRRVAARIAAPLHAIGVELASRPDDSVAPVTLPPGASTELALLARQLNGALARTERALERERNFTRFASHELRTPVAVMQAALERLEDSARPEQEAALARAARGLRDMHALIDTFLALSRESAPAAAPVAVDAEWIARLHRHLSGARPLPPPVIEEQGVPALAAPEPVLHVLLGGLLKNAMQHGEPGTVRVRLDAHGIVVENAVAEQGDEHGYGLGTQIARRVCDLFGWQHALRIEDGIARASIIIG